MMLGFPVPWSRPKSGVSRTNPSRLLRISRRSSCFALHGRILAAYFGADTALRLKVDEDVNLEIPIPWLSRALYDQGCDTIEGERYFSNHLVGVGATRVAQTMTMIPFPVGLVVHCRAYPRGRSVLTIRGKLMRIGNRPFWAMDGVRVLELDRNRPMTSSQGDFLED